MVFSSKVFMTLNLMTGLVAVRAKEERMVQAFGLSRVYASHLNSVEAQLHTGKLVCMDGT